MEVHRAVHRVVVARAEFEAIEQQVAQLRRAVAAGLQSDGVAVAPRGELALDRAQQVLRILVVHPEFGVARNAELVATRDLHAGEQPGDEMLDHLRKVRELHAPRVARRQLQDARQRARHLDDCERHVAPEGVAALELDREVQALVLDAREGARRVEAERREHRLDLVVEVSAEPLDLCGAPVRRAQHVDALGLQLWLQPGVEQGVLRLDHPQRLLADRCKLRVHVHAVRPAAARAEFAALLESRHADLEELVEVVAGDREEAEPLEERHGGIPGLRENAAVELQEREFPVDVELRRGERGLGHVLAPAGWRHQASHGNVTDRRHAPADASARPGAAAISGWRAVDRAWRRSSGRASRTKPRPVSGIRRGNATGSPCAAAEGSPDFSARR